jgi:hypothetical protein
LPISDEEPVEAAGAVDAKSAPTAPWKPQNGFHSYHRQPRLFVEKGTFLFR